MNRLLFTLLSFSFISCSYFIESYDSNFIRNDKIKVLDQTKTTFCKKPSSHIYLNDNKHSQEMFDPFLSNLEKKRLLSFIDKAVLWSFLQMNLRPDLSSPSSKIQTLLLIGGEEYYFNSYSEDKTAFPYLHLQGYLLKKFKSRYNLVELATIYDKEIPKDMKVSKSLALFLKENQNEINNSDNLKRLYMRGDETLKEKEGLPFLSIKKLVRIYNRSKNKTNYKVTTGRFTSKEEHNSFVSSCNFDMDLYKDSLFLISQEKIDAHIFGLKYGKNIFMGASSQGIDSFSLNPDLITLKGNSNIRSAALCSYKNKLSPQQKLWLISSHSRDPGQHLFHLNEYELDKITNLPELDSMLRFSRHLFLKNPVRLVIESQRSEKKQIEELLKLNISLYSAKKLGNIWAFFSHNAHKSKGSSFLSDSRNQGHILCGKN